MLYTNVSLDHFYRYLQAATLPEYFNSEEKDLTVIDHGKDGDIIFLGPGEPPPELKNLTIEEINKLNPEIVYQTPVSLDGSPLNIDFKESREKLNKVIENMEDEDDT